MYDYLVVDAELLGSVFVHEAKGKKVLFVDKCLHIGGNIYTEKAERINAHKYRTYIFRSNTKNVWSYITRFAEFDRFTKFSCS